jgi:hypothetical protein
MGTLRYRKRAVPMGTQEYAKTLGREGEGKATQG